MKIILTKNEQKIENALAKGEYRRVPKSEKSNQLFAEAIQNFEELRKSKRVTIRIKNKDLIKVKAKAQKTGIPYQTLLNALIHQYAEGKTGITF
ncbi:hypothetical protein COT66_01240 [Candidatus Shapirobacteria bacterium CG09_land_8_20_14_0_10_49_15]|uniref:Antitoxin n=2 Tax=Candidatus Shapironibacteriota TaxID=1752721 RepID=A0A2M8L6I4_9BACT|nr:MAG: hypothetical protein COT66_01240 [Candidatus Shapirobacteria bacterium CG09_land_8_20_14_0_10_49_15]PJE69826.1 MAG: hypothetical protein COU97_03035 [Candidatus Shapirobacteria bacterium CG10_big_fil_rev_8_21_14_0_10_48_15]